MYVRQKVKFEWWIKYGQLTVIKRICIPVKRIQGGEEGIAVRLNRQW